MKGFSIKTEIEEFDTFAEFAADADLGSDDLVLCGEHTYQDYIAELNTGVQTLFREKYSKGEPTDGDVDAILNALREKKYDRIIAVGGGTVIDIAKVIAVAGPDDTVDDLYDNVDTLKQIHPLIIIPTTCGTGSEVTNISVINRVSKGVKMGLASNAMLPDKAVLITNLLTSLPYKIFATSSIDAMVHSVESFLSPNGCSISRVFFDRSIKDNSFLLVESSCSRRWRCVERIRSRILESIQLGRPWVWIRRMCCSACVCISTWFGLSYSAWSVEPAYVCLCYEKI